MDAINNYYRTLAKQVDQMQRGVVNHPLLVCDFCGGNHLNGHCAPKAPNPSSVIYLGNSIPWIVISMEVAI